jgi:hypothetical protein
LAFVKEIKTFTFMLKKIFLSIVALTLFGACQKEESEIESAEVSSFGLIQDKIFTTRCATPGCHASEKDGLVLTKSVAYDRLINVSPINANAIKDGLKQVKPFDAGKSLLYHKLEGNANGHHQSDYGKQMPLGGKPLTDNEIEFVRRWIAAGAPKTGDIVDKKLLN